MIERTNNTLQIHSDITQVLLVQRSAGTIRRRYKWGLRTRECWWFLGGGALKPLSPIIYGYSLPGLLGYGKLVGSARQKMTNTQHIQNIWPVLPLTIANQQCTSMPLLMTGVIFVKLALPINQQLTLQRCFGNVCFGIMCQSPVTG